MSLVFAQRKSLNGEPGTHLVDVDIFKPNGKTKILRAQLFITFDEAKIEGIVVGGCTNGLELFSDGTEVTMRPIERDGYTHMLCA